MITHQYWEVVCPPGRWLSSGRNAAQAPNSTNLGHYLTAARIKFSTSNYHQQGIDPVLAFKHGQPRPEREDP